MRCTCPDSLCNSAFFGTGPMRNRPSKVCQAFNVSTAHANSGLLDALQGTTCASVVQKTLVQSPYGKIQRKIHACKRQLMKQDAIHQSRANASLSFPQKVHFCKSMQRCSAGLDVPRQPSPYFVQRLLQYLDLRLKSKIQFLLWFFGRRTVSRCFC